MKKKLTKPEQMEVQANEWVYAYFEGDYSIGAVNRPMANVGCGNFCC
jgi:hypothetical protein